MAAPGRRRSRRTRRRPGTAPDDPAGRCSQRADRRSTEAGVGDIERGDDRQAVVDRLEGRGQVVPSRLGKGGRPEPPGRTGPGWPGCTGAARRGEDRIAAPARSFPGRRRSRSAARSGRRRQRSRLGPRRARSRIRRRAGPRSASTPRPTPSTGGSVPSTSPSGVTRTRSWNGSAGSQRRHATAADRRVRCRGRGRFGSPDRQGSIPAGCAGVSRRRFRRAPRRPGSRSGRRAARSASRRPPQRR